MAGEDAGKVELIAEAVLFADLSEGQIPQLKISLSGGDDTGAQVFDGWYAHLLLEFSLKGGGGEKDGLGKRAYRQRYDGGMHG